MIVESIRAVLYLLAEELGNKDSLSTFLGSSYRKINCEGNKVAEPVYLPYVGNVSLGP